MQSYPSVWPHVISVRQTRDLLSPSFRFHLTMDTRKADNAQPAEGRVQAQFPVGDLLLEKGVVVLRSGKVQHRVPGWWYWVMKTALP